MTWGIFKRDSVSATFEKLQEEEKQRTRDGYKVYSNSHNDPEHHTKHDSLDSAKAELAKHKGGALYHGGKLYNKKTGVFESVEQLSVEQQLSEAAVSTIAKAHGFVKHTSGWQKGSYEHPKTGETITPLRHDLWGHSRKDGSTVSAFKHKSSLEKHLADHGYKKESVNEGWDDMLKSVKDKNATQPNGGSGKKQGTRYGGGKQKDDEAEKRKEKNESVEVSEEYKVYSNSHTNPDHHTKHSTLDSAKAELSKHQGGALYHGGKLYNKKSGVFESVEQIDELKKSTLGSYVKKASDDRADTGYHSGYWDRANGGGKPEKMSQAHKEDGQEKRKKGIERAVHRLTKEDLDEEKQGEIVKMGAKEIKHANMKDKQDDAEIMEPHSEGEANFIDKHYVNVTDDPTATKQDGGAGKLGKATAPKGQGPAAYKGDSKLSDKDKASYKEGTSEEGSNTINEEKSSGKKSFSSFKAKVTG